MITAQVMKRKKQGEGVCPYCRKIYQNKDMTADHVPPRGFFGRAGNQNLQLVTVRACKSCNNSGSVGDEALKGMLSLGGGNQMAATGIRDEVSRSLKRRPKWAKQLRAHTAILGTRPFRRPDGVEAHAVPLTGWLKAEVESTILRITKGLYFHCDPEWDWTQCDFSYRQVYRPEEPDLWDEIGTIPVLESAIETGAGQFKMSWGAIGEVPGCRVMWQNYYDQTGIFIVAEPIQSHARIHLGGSGNLWWIDDHFSKELGDSSFETLPGPHEECVEGLNLIL